MTRKPFAWRDALFLIRRLCGDLWFVLREWLRGDKGRD